LQDQIIITHPKLFTKDQ